MDDQPRILQQRIEVATLQRHRKQPRKRVGGEQQERQKPDADQRHDAEHARDHMRRQLPRPDRHRAGPQPQHQRPQQQRAFVRTPHCRIAVHHRQQAVGILGDVAHRKILHQEGVRQHGEGRCDQCQLHQRRRSRHGHPAAASALCAGQRHHGLHQRHQQGQHQQQRPEFRKHRVGALSSMGRCHNGKCTAESEFRQQLHLLAHAR